MAKAENASPVQSSPRKILDKSHRKCIMRIHLQEKCIGVTKPGEKKILFIATAMERLSAISKKLGFSASEILRPAIDEYWVRFERKEKK
jgi:hypothetical protein